MALVPGSVRCLTASRMLLPDQRRRRSAEIENQPKTAQASQDHWFGWSGSADGIFVMMLRQPPVPPDGSQSHQYDSGDDGRHGNGPGHRKRVEAEQAPAADKRAGRKQWSGSGQTRYTVADYVTYDAAKGPRHHTHQRGNRQPDHTRR